MDVDLDHISDGIVVRGAVRATWRGECSRCLRDLAEPLELHVDELFEREPVVGETYPLAGHEIDLDQLLRDAVLLELPLAPHCEPPCAAPQTGEDTDTDDAPVDPRWAVLSELEI